MIGVHDAVAVIVVLLLASIVFFTAALIAMALMLRTHWDDLGKSPGQHPDARPRRDSDRRPL